MALTMKERGEKTQKRQANRRNDSWPVLQVTSVIKAMTSVMEIQGNNHESRKRTTDFRIKAMTSNPSLIQILRLLLDETMTGSPS